MVKIRLKQQGKKGQKNYRIIVTESANWRDGRSIADIGFYNPITNPSTVKLDLDKYNDWVSKGAQPTNTVKKLVANVFKAK